MVLLIPCFGACGKKAPKEIVLFPYASRNISASSGASFTCSDKTVATVDDSGLVLAIKPGTATVTVKEGKKA